jgi:3-dehydroquinate dehydratase II
VAIVVLNGPNLDRLGTREPDVYGMRSYADLEKLCQAVAEECGVDVDVRQTADEATMIGWLHEAADSGAGVVINAAAWTHTSIAIRDAATILTAPWIEVHLSNVHAREEFRHRSYLSDLASGVIVGLGVQGYAAAIRYLAGGEQRHLAEGAR